MSPVIQATLIWVPRLVGIALALFLGFLALSMPPTGPVRAPAWMETGVSFMPAMIVAGAVAAAWRVPIVGALLFVLYAGGYAALASDRPDWILAISGPLVGIAMLYLLSARVRGRRTAHRALRT